MPNERIKWIDHVRAFAMISIVLGHALGEFDGTNALKDWVYLFNVPLCVMVSGYLFKDQSDFRASLKQINKVFIRYYVPYLFWGAVSIVAYLAVIERGNWAKALPYIGGLLYGNGSFGNDSAIGNLMIWNRPLWYIPCIFMIELVAVFLSLIKIKEKRLIYFVSFTVLGFVLYHFVHPHAIFMELESMVYLMPFFWLGSLLREKESLFAKLRNNKIVGVAVGILLIAAGSFIGFKNGFITYLSDTLGNYYLVFILSAAMISGGIMLIEKSLSYGCRALTYIGMNTLPILMTHKFSIVACSMMLKKVMQPSGFISVTAISLVITVIAVSVALAIGFVFSKFAPILIGKKSKKQHATQ